MIDLHVVEASSADAATIVDVVHTAFRARPPLDPPGTALAETVESVRTALAEHGGLLALVDGTPAGAMLFDAVDAVDTADAVDMGGSWLELRRVSVHPHFQRRGVATAMVGCAEEVAGVRDLVGLRLRARAELPETVEFWQRRGYLEIDRQGTNLSFAKALPVELDVPTAADMNALGARLAALLAAGDLVVVTGELGAGKTTLTQGLGEGLGVRGRVTSPTFVIARVHPSQHDGPPLVHVDAYRLGGVAELDDLDLDTEIADAVTVVEWGGGLAEGLAEDRLEVVLHRALGGTERVDGSGEDAADLDPRRARLIPVGRRWVNGRLRAALSGPPAVLGPAELR